MYNKENQIITIITYPLLLGNLLVIARNFQVFPSIQMDSFPLLSFSISPLSQSCLSRYSILFIFCLSFLLPAAFRHGGNGDVERLYHTWQVFPFPSFPLSFEYGSKKQYGIIWSSISQYSQFTL